MSQAIDLEMEYEGAHFSGRVVTTDASFDHAFGRELQSDFEIEDFRVGVWINGIYKDVTKAFTAKELEGYKEHFREYAEEQMRESA